MFRFALHLTGRREDAEDVVQFVFIQAFGQLEDGNELSNPRAWLMRATKNRSLNLIRDRRELPTDDLRVESRPSDSADRDELAALAAVRATLWALPEYIKRSCCATGADSHRTRLPTCFRRPPEQSNRY